MKKTLLLLSLCSGFALIAQDGPEFAPSMGWHFGGSISFVEGKLDVKDNVNYGIDIAYPVAPDLRVVLSYTYFSTSASFRPYSGFAVPGSDFNLDEHIIFLGAHRELDINNDRIVPYGLPQVGVGWVVSDIPGADDPVRLTIGLGAAIKFYLSDRLGLRFQGRFIMPLYFQGVGVYFGGGGSGLSLNSAVPLLQGDLSGALIIRP